MQVTSAIQHTLLLDDCWKVLQPSEYIWSSHVSMNEKSSTLLTDYILWKKLEGLIDDVVQTGINFIESVGFVVTCSGDRTVWSNYFSVSKTSVWIVPNVCFVYASKNVASCLEILAQNLFQYFQRSNSILLEKYMFFNGQISITDKPGIGSPLKVQIDKKFLWNFEVPHKANLKIFWTT